MRSRRQFLLFAASLFALLLVAAVFLLLPMRTELGATEAQLTMRRDELTGIRDYMDAHQDRAAYEAQLKRQSTMVHRLLPDAMDTQRFLESVESKAKASNVFIRRVLPETPVADSDAVVETQYITVEFTGDYFAILSFLSAMEDDRFSSIRQAETMVDGETLRTRLHLSIYAQP